MVINSSTSGLSLGSSFKHFLTTSFTLSVIASSGFCFLLSPLHALVRESPVAAQHTDTQAAPRLVGSCLEWALANQTSIEGASERPDVDLRIDDGAGLDVEEFRCAVRHGGVLGSSVLNLEGQRARGDGCRGWSEGAKVHEDGSYAVVVYHYVSCGSC